MGDTSDNDIIHEEGEGTTKHNSGQVVDDGEDPKLGMTFDNLDVSYKFYNDYARRIGFSVRKMRTNKNKYNPNIFDSQTLCCSFEGEYHEVKVPKKRREHTRSGCKAEFHVNFINGKFKLTRFTAEHNHGLVPPDQAHLLRSHRKVLYPPNGRITKLHSAKIGQSRRKIGQSRSHSYEEPISSNEDLLATARYGELSQLSQRIVAKGAKSPMACSLAKKLLLDIEVKLDAMSNSDEERGNTSGGATSVIHEDVNEDEPLDRNSERFRGQLNGGKKNALETKAQKNNETSKQTGQGHAMTETMERVSNVYQPSEESFNSVARPEFQALEAASTSMVRPQLYHNTGQVTTPQTSCTPTNESEGLHLRLFYTDRPSFPDSTTS